MISVLKLGGSQWVWGKEISPKVVLGRKAILGQGRIYLGLLVGILIRGAVDDNYDSMF